MCRVSTTGTATRSSREAAEPLESLGGLAGDGWLVGGAVRDRLLGRPTTDFDVVIAGDVGPAARTGARRSTPIRSDCRTAFGAWRVVARDRRWQIDLLPLGGETIENDLARRDLTVNAIAEPLGGGEWSTRSAGSGISALGDYGWCPGARSRMIHCG